MRRIRSKIAPAILVGAILIPLQGACADGVDDHRTDPGWTEFDVPYYIGPAFMRRVDVDGVDCVILTAGSYGGITCDWDSLTP